MTGTPHAVILRAPTIPQFYTLPTSDAASKCWAFANPLATVVATSVQIDKGLYRKQHIAQCGSNTLSLPAYLFDQPAGKYFSETRTLSLAVQLFDDQPPSTASKQS
jgi:hypothetical protein